MLKKILIGLYLAYSASTETIIIGSAIYYFFIR